MYVTRSLLSIEQSITYCNCKLGRNVASDFGVGLSAYHRLNGSSSPVLTATSLSYGKAKNSTPHRIKTPGPIEIKFGRVDYVGEETRHAKFYANPSKGGFPAWVMGNG